jgi:hypothetical protein
VPVRPRDRLSFRWGGYGSVGQCGRKAKLAARQGFQQLMNLDRGRRQPIRQTGYIAEAKQPASERTATAHDPPEGPGQRDEW